MEVGEPQYRWAWTASKTSETSLAQEGHTSQSLWDPQHLHWFGVTTEWITDDHERLPLGQCPSLDVGNSAVHR